MSVHLVVQELQIHFLLLVSLYDIDGPASIVIHIALFYCGFYRATKAIRKKDDSLNSIISGALSGALYKSASSKRVLGRYTLISAGKFALKK